MLTIAHADRGRPTLKDDERFRNGYFHDNNIHKHDKSLGLNYDAVFEDAFRNRSSSFSVFLPRSACAILSIVSVYKLTILSTLLVSNVTSMSVNVSLC